MRSGNNGEVAYALLPDGADIVASDGHHRGRPRNWEYHRTCPTRSTRLVASRDRSQKSGLSRQPRRDNGLGRSTRPNPDVDFSLKCETIENNLSESEEELDEIQHHLSLFIPQSQPSGQEKAENATEISSSEDTDVSTAPKSAIVDNVMRFLISWLDRRFGVAARPINLQATASCEAVESVTSATKRLAISPPTPVGNWTRISDIDERRRIQDRIYQRNYRLYPPSFSPSRFLGTYLAMLA